MGNFELTTNYCIWNLNQVLKEEVVDFEEVVEGKSPSIDVTEK
jgi:hypothetical protein